MRLFAVVILMLLTAWIPELVLGKNPLALAQGAHGPTGTSPADAMTPEEKMRRRFPQPVRVGNLIGARVLDDGDVTIGRVRQVVRTSEGRILLITDFGGSFGWRARSVAVPIEVVALIGANVAAIDVQPDEFAKAPTWAGNGAQPLPPD